MPSNTGQSASPTGPRLKRRICAPGRDEGQGERGRGAKKVRCGASKCDTRPAVCAPNSSVPAAFRAACCCCSGGGAQGAGRPGSRALLAPMRVGGGALGSQDGAGVPAAAGGLPPPGAGGSLQDPCCRIPARFPQDSWIPRLHLELLLVLWRHAHEEVDIVCVQGRGGESIMGAQPGICRHTGLPKAPSGFLRHAPYSALPKTRAH